MRNEEGEDLLEGVPSLSGKSSLSKGVTRDRGLTVNKLGIAGTFSGRKEGREGEVDWRCVRCLCPVALCCYWVPIFLCECCEQHHCLCLCAGGSPEGLGCRFD